MGSSKNKQTQDGSAGVAGAAAAIGRALLFPQYNAVELAVAATQYFAGAAGDVDEATTDHELALLASKQRLTLELLEGRASVAQELAIAQRIATAEEVEIEEYYDGSGEGFAGLDAKADANTQAFGASLGLGGKGQVIRKRVIRMKGGEFDEAAVAFIQRNLGESSVDISGADDVADDEGVA